MALAFLLWIVSWSVLKKIGQERGLGFNLTGSQPPGIYIYYPIDKPLQRGDLVDVWLDFPQYKKQKLLKNIAALPGDWLFTVSSSVYVCRRPFFTSQCVHLGHCLKKDKQGSVLLCQQWQAFEIPPDYFYLQSKRVLNSFDSRYFGLVSVKNIHHRVKMLRGF